MGHADTDVTKEAAQFAHRLAFDDLPAEALRIAKRCILDGTGLILAGFQVACKIAEAI